MEASVQNNKTIEINDEFFGKFLDQRGDDDGFRAIHQSGWETFQKLEWPNLMDESWRRTDIRGLNVAKYAVSAHSSSATVSGDKTSLPKDYKSFIDTGVEHQAIRVNSDGVPILSLVNGSLPAGVIFTDLATAMKEHKELITAHLSKAVPMDEDKFTALHYSFMTGGLFLYVPKNLKIELPLYFFDILKENHTALYSHLLVIVDESSEVSLLRQNSSVSPETEGFHDGITEIFLKQNAKMRFVDIEDWNTKTYHLTHQRAYLSKDAHLEWVSVGLGGKLSKNELNTHLVGEGTVVNMLGVICSTGRQHFDYHTLQDHDAPHATSDLLFNSVLNDRSRVVFRGMIHVHPHAQKTNAYQKNNNLTMNADARADSIPGLEILANDVRCTHGSTTGEIDKEQLMYLLSRGISQRRAESLIVEGFFETVFARISSEYVKERVRKLVLKKLALSRSQGE